MIIRSLLDNDFYKFSMMQAVLHNYPDAWVKYKFKCRNQDRLDTLDQERLVSRVRSEIYKLCELKFREGELDYLFGIPYFTMDFIDYLSLFKLNFKHIKVFLDNKGRMSIEIEGPWVLTILFEVPILAIVSEVYHEHLHSDQLGQRMVDGLKLLDSKIDMVENGPNFADFGTRRRFSRSVQGLIVKRLVEKSNTFIGTSNVYLAKKHGIKPIGTMAHEWIQAHQQLRLRVVDSQKSALQTWADEYRGDLGIALSDTIGFDAFLKDFDKYFAKLFDGCRHDSGDPIKWCRKLIDHYEKLGIDPKTKTAVFSDGLTVKSMLNIWLQFKDDINVSFGIGTSLTNDMGVRPLQIVIKMVECNGQPVCKISDSFGKGMCEDDEYLKYVKKVFKVGG
jgi:nicotinate phosphoribosyltransferase